MTFWSSAEISPEAAQPYRQVMNCAESEINSQLASSSTAPIWDGWKWAFVAIIVSAQLGVDYSERVRRDNKRRVFEFRLKIDFEDFVSSQFQNRANLVFTQLHRSVDLMAKWAISIGDRAELHNALSKAQASLREE
jgi:hypothetical protein